MNRIVVDEVIDVFDAWAEWAAVTGFQAEQGLIVLPCRARFVDRPNAHDSFTSKVGIDATKPLGADAAMFEKATM